MERAVMEKALTRMSRIRRKIRIKPDFKNTIEVFLKKHSRHSANS